jgi:hypothetical protein
MRKAWSLGGLTLLVVLLGACTPGVSGTPSLSVTSGVGADDTTILAELRSAIDAGVECPGLFETFDRINENSPDFSDAQGEMINIGCYMRDSQRNDAELAAQAPDSPWLGVPGEQVTPAETCTQAAVAAASEADAERAEPLIAATLDACTSVDEWMSVVQLHPGVMGMTDGYIPQLVDLQAVCYTYVETAVCQDAVARNLDVGPQ